MKIHFAFAIVRSISLLHPRHPSTTDDIKQTTTVTHATTRLLASYLLDRNQAPSTVIDEASQAPGPSVASGLALAREIDNSSITPVLSVQYQSQVLLQNQPSSHGDALSNRSETYSQAAETNQSALSPCAVSAQRRVFPLSLVVNHESLKQALLVAACCPGCGVLIEGRRGTGKSVLARSLQNLVPSNLIRVRNSPFNIDPDGFIVDSFLEHHLEDTGNSLAESPTEVVETPFVTVPLGVQEDALIGSVDLEQSLESGQTVYSPGLLARAHRGILYVDEVNLLDDDVASLLFQILADGWVSVEREGLSVRYPCQPLVLATYNPAEGELRQHLVDRFALHVSADDDELTVPERVQGVLNAEAWLDASSSSRRRFELQERVRMAQDEDKILRERVQLARDLLPQVELYQEQLDYLCETATRADCEGQRGEVFAAKVAKASAALGNRTRVNAEDLELGVLLSIAPRARVWSQLDEPPPPPPPPPQSQAPDSQLTPLTPEVDAMLPDVSDPKEQPEDNAPEEKSIEQDDDREEEPEPEPSGEEEEEEELQIPLEFLFGVDASAVVDPRLLAFRKRTRVGKAGRRSRTFNVDRGRFVKAIFPRCIRRGHLAVGATLRAAAPFQLSRRRRIPKRREGDRRAVVVTKDDFRIQQLKKKTGSLVIFVVDASGSMALNRMSAAKGAAMGLLQEAYQSRDKIALIAFHGAASTVVVPPTKALALARRRLEGLPCGSRTPLADALACALRLGTNALKVTKDAGRVVVVILTDGRANVPLCVSQGGSFDPSADPASQDGQPSRAFLKAEVLALAKRMGANLDFDVLVIDTEDQFVGTGVARELARAADGHYCHLARADRKSVSHAVQQVVGGGAAVLE